MTDVEIIQGVIDRLKKPENWLKYVRSKTADDRHINETNPEAVKFCLGGAIINVTQNLMWDGWWFRPMGDEGMGFHQTKDTVAIRLHRLAQDRGFSGFNPFVEFNNAPTTTHEDLMLFLKEALYDAQADEAKANIAANDDMP